MRRRFRLSESQSRLPDGHCERDARLTPMIFSPTEVGDPPDPRRAQFDPTDGIREEPSGRNAASREIEANKQQSLEPSNRR